MNGVKHRPRSQREPQTWMGLGAQPTSREGVMSAAEVGPKVSNGLVNYTNTLLISKVMLAVMRYCKLQSLYAHTSPKVADASLK